MQRVCLSFRCCYRRLPAGEIIGMCMCVSYAPLKACAIYARRHNIESLRSLSRNEADTTAADARENTPKQYAGIVVRFPSTRTAKFSMHMRSSRKKKPASSDDDLIYDVYLHGGAANVQINSLKEILQQKKKHQKNNQCLCFWSSCFFFSFNFVCTKLQFEFVVFIGS